MRGAVASVLRYNPVRLTEFKNEFIKLAFNVFCLITFNNTVSSGII